MKTLTATVASLSMMVLIYAQKDKTAATPGSDALPPVLTLADVRMVSPALERYTQRLSSGRFVEAARFVGSDHTYRVLCRLAQCLLGGSRRQGRL
jgi:hypothetical protein